MKKFLLVFLGVLVVFQTHATKVKVTIEMDNKVCVIERFRNDGSTESKITSPIELMVELKDLAQNSLKGLENKSLGQMSVFAIGDTFNVINDNSPIPFPNWRFMRYFSLNTGGNQTVFASIKICEAIDSTSGNWLYYTTGMQIYATDDSLLTDFGVWNPCIEYAYGVDLYLGTDTAKSPLEIVQILSCTSIAEFSPKKTISVYPNPTSDILNVDQKFTFDEAIIYASDGKVMWQGIAGQNGIDVRGFSNGLYVLSSKNGTARFIKKE